eukprot:GHVU01191342.1.p1 GENE.GHVU01191342.1~~GHVU01191342.1.p1  ORF type:complete len:274 (-),score=28.82 GHVU01191342.1:937-1758(-)
MLTLLDAYHILVQKVALPTRRSSSISRNRTNARRRRSGSTGGPADPRKRVTRAALMLRWTSALTPSRGSSSSFCSFSCACFSPFSFFFLFFLFSSSLSSSLSSSHSSSCSSFCCCCCSRSGDQPVDPKSEEESSSAEGDGLLADATGEELAAHDREPRANAVPNYGAKKDTGGVLRCRQGDGGDLRPVPPLRQEGQGERLITMIIIIMREQTGGPPHPRRPKAASQSVSQSSVLYHMCSQSTKRGCTAIVTGRMSKRRRRTRPGRASVTAQGP